MEIETKYIYEPGYSVTLKMLHSELEELLDELSGVEGRWSTWISQILSEVYVDQEENFEANFKDAEWVYNPIDTISYEDELPMNTPETPREQLVRMLNDLEAAETELEAQEKPRMICEVHGGTFIDERGVCCHSPVGYVPGHICKFPLIEA